MKILPRQIAFDIDGVFAGTFRLFVYRARKEFGYQFHYENIMEYEFKKAIDIDEKIREKIIQHLLDDPLKSGVRPIEGAVEILTRLSAIGPLLFVTARTRRTPILRWIHHQLPAVDMNFIYLEATNTHQKKLPLLMRNGVKYFVEDRLETCYLLEKISVFPIVFEQPWNRKPHPFPVVKSWDGISAMIEW